MFRHQPPAAMYLPLSKLKAGIGRSDEDILAFREALQKYLGVRACFLASSARTALFLLLQSLSAAHPERPNILLPAYTCPVLVKVILDVGLRPCPIDISPDTFAFDRDQLTAHLNERVLAVIHVHPFGIPLPLEETLALAHDAGAFVIEDTAQAMGARWQGKQAGTMADFGLFSLGPGKPLSVAGGGVLCTNDEKQAQVLEEVWQQLPSASLPAAAWAFIRLLLIRLATDPQGWWLAARSGTQRWGQHSSSWGYKLRQLSPVQAGIGRTLLPELDRINGIRRQNGRQIAAHLQNDDIGQVLEPDENADPIYLRLPLIVNTAEHRERLFHKFWQANISAGRLYEYALPKIFPELDAPACPGAEQIAQRLLTLPTHHYLTPKDIARMGDLLDQDH